MSMRLPAVLVGAHYLVIMMCLFAFVLSLTQLMTNLNTLNDIETQISVLDVVTAYSGNTTEFYSVYQDLQLA